MFASPSLATFGFVTCGFKARTPVRDFLRNLRRWLTYRPERRYLGRPGRGPLRR